MATIRETQECLPKDIVLGALLIPAPEPNHEHCSGGYATPGVMGGWMCPCTCHHSARSTGAKSMAEPDERVEYGIMLDCDKEGCEKKIGHRHSDHGMISPRRPSRAQIEEYKVDGKWLINNHAATLVCRTYSPWEPVQLIDGQVGDSDG